MLPIRHSLVLITFLLISIGLKVLGAWLIPLYDDGGAIVFLADYHDSAGMNLIVNPHNQLLTWVYTATTRLFGRDSFGVRAHPVFFSIITLGLVCLFVWRYYSIEVALWTIFLGTTSYFIFYSSLLPESEGGLIPLFCFFMLFLLYKSLKEDRLIWILLTGVVSGLIALTEIQYLLFVITSVALFFFYKKSAKQTLKMCLIVGIFVVSFFMITPFLIIFAHTQYATELIKELLFFTTTNSFSLLPKLLHPFLLLNLFTSLTPLMVGLIIIRIGIAKKCNNLFLNWFLISLLIFMVGIPSDRLLNTKYFSFLWPALIIICGESITNLRLKVKELILIGSLAIGMSIFLFFYNQYSSDFWFLMDTISYVIKINQDLLFLLTIFSFICLGAFLVLRQSGFVFSRLSLILFLSSGFAFNIFLISEIMLDQTANSLLGDFVDYTKNNNVDYPIFSWNEEVPFYLGVKGYHPINFEKPFLIRYAKEKLGFNESGYIDLDTAESLIRPLLKKGGTIFLYNHPYKYFILNNTWNQKRIQLIQQYCHLVKSFSYKIATGEVYTCPKNEVSDE